MNLLALAIAPGLAICLFIFHRDAYNREPKLNLIVSFLLGVLTIIPAIYIEGFFSSFFDNSIAGTAVTTFLVVALTEELGKFAVLRLYAFPKKSFDEPLDGIVYGVIIGMGFATLENIFYVYSNGVGVGILRMFLSVPAHATFGIILGYYAGKAKMNPDKRGRLLLTGLLLAILFHGFFDFFLFVSSSPDVTSDTGSALLVLGALASFVVAIVLSWRQLKLHRRLSQQTYRPEETMSIRHATPNDIPLIRDLTNKIWPTAYGTILSKDQLDYMLTLLYSESALLQQMREQNEFVIAYDDKEPVGFASIGPLAPQTYKLHKLYILPSQQGRGTGKFVLEQLIKALLKKGVTTLQLNVNRQNPAKNFYEKLGFSVIREEDIDIGHGYFMNDYVMEKKLV